VVGRCEDLYRGASTANAGLLAIDCQHALRSDVLDDHGRKLVQAAMGAFQHAWDVQCDPTTTAEQLDEAFREATDAATFALVYAKAHLHHLERLPELPPVIAPVVDPPVEVTLVAMRGPVPLAALPRRRMLMAAVDASDPAPLLVAVPRERQAA
jgi:hypothetical protein